MSFPRVLFLHSNTPDYLSEGLFHGLRKILGENCVDVPRYDVMYSPLSMRVRDKLRGFGFTLYGLLPEIEGLPAERFFWEKSISSFDLIVVTDIWNNGPLLKKIRTLNPSVPLATLDSSDFPRFFPYSRRDFKQAFFLKDVLPTVTYYKRERLSGFESKQPWYWMDFLSEKISLFKESKSLGFAIPEEKISIAPLSEKKKTFAAHVVDEEVQRLLKNNVKGYLFQQEKDYYRDLGESKFGVTMRRAGWDCLRHYEIASQGCVPCFRNLNLKAALCAPFGLDDGNCVIYSNAGELLEKVNQMKDDDYQKLQDGAAKWISNHTTEVRGREFLRELGYDVDSQKANKFESARG